MLYFKFYLHYFPISKVDSLRKEVLTFRQLEQESLSKSWEHFNELITFGLDLGFPDLMLLQYFYLGLTKESKESLDLASRGAFLHLPITEARPMLEKVVQAYPKLSKEEKESSPEQEEEVLVAKIQSPQSQDLAINPKPSKPHNDDLDFQLAKMLVHRSDLLRRASWKKCPQLPFPPKGNQEKYMDGMSSDTIEGELSHSRINHIFSPSIPILDNLSKPNFKSILDPNDPSHTLSTKSHNDPKNSLEYPKYRSHEDYRNDQEEQHQQWHECMEHIKLICHYQRMDGGG